MFILLMRHAEREPEAPGSPPERDLPLTARGILQVADIARQLEEKLKGFPQISFVLSSPHRAAMESATRLLSALGAGIGPSAHAALDPDVTNVRDPRPLAKAVEDLSPIGEGLALVVGHQPLLGELGRSWTGGRVSPVRGGLACIEKHGTEARLLWMLEPRLSTTEVTA